MKQERKEKQQEKGNNLQVIPRKQLNELGDIHEFC
jgi:hypothetical protein